MPSCRHCRLRLWLVTNAVAHSHKDVLRATSHPGQQCGRVRHQYRGVCLPPGPHLPRGHVRLEGNAPHPGRRLSQHLSLRSRHENEGGLMSLLVLTVILNNSNNNNMLKYYFNISKTCFYLSRNFYRLIKFWIC